MATYSLLNVTSKNSDGTVDGYWLQDHVGTYEAACAKATRTEAANSNKITVAVVEPIEHPTPMLEFWTSRRLATPRSQPNRTERTPTDAKQEAVARQG